VRVDAESIARPSASSAAPSHLTVAEDDAVGAALETARRNETLTA
jgi:hypothetical protein